MAPLPVKLQQQQGSSCAPAPSSTSTTLLQGPARGCAVRPVVLPVTRCLLRASPCCAHLLSLCRGPAGLSNNLGVQKGGETLLLEPRRSDPVLLRPGGGPGGRQGWRLAVPSATVPLPAVMPWFSALHVSHSSGGNHSFTPAAGVSGKSRA